MASFNDLPYEVILLISESFDRVADIFRFSRVCRSIRDFFEKGNLRTEVIKRVLARSPRFRTELWLNLFIELNNLGNDEFQTHSPEIKACWNLGLRLVTLYIDEVRSTKTNYSSLSLVCRLDQAEMARAQICKLDDETVWNILTRRCNIALLYDLYEGCLPEYSQSLYPWPAYRAWERDHLDEGDAEIELAAQERVVFRPKLALSSSKKGSDDQNLFIAAAMELWLTVEICDWIGFCRPRDRGARHALLRDLVRLPSNRVDGDVLVDLVYKLEVFDFLYSYLLGRAQAGSLNFALSKWEASPENERVGSWTDEVSFWKVLNHPRTMRISPMGVLDIVASSLNRRAGWHYRYRVRELIERKAAERKGYSSLHRAEDEIGKSPRDLRMLEHCFFDHVQLIAKVFPELGLSVNSPSHFRANWHIGAQGTVFSWGKNRCGVLSRLKQISGDARMAELTMHIIGSEFMSFQELGNWLHGNLDPLGMEEM